MIGFLIISHGSFGEALIHCASHVLGRRPLRVRQIGITVHDNPDVIVPMAQEWVRQLDQGDGVLVFTDMLGATPSNIATRLLIPGRVEMVAGVNLPMLVRALTYRNETLATLIDKATSGGRDGVVYVEGTTNGTTGS